MGQETVGEEHHGAALIASVGVLLDDLLTPLTRMVGHQAGMSGDETENTDVGPLPFTSWTRQIDGPSPVTNLVFLQRYPLLGLIYVASASDSRFAPRAFVHVIDSSPKMSELRPERRTTRVLLRPPSTRKVISARETPFGKPLVIFTRLVRVIRIRLEFDPPVRHTMHDTVSFHFDVAALALCV
ncbi:hypothetical protein AB4305_24880 [Nocardia sp. 2YAB30]|uniref:hypothetical protein n=1 Tax=Nocardia sp. 2YAB30 TaxID=3233022 RepID=UPI003F996A1D